MLGLMDRDSVNNHRNVEQFAMDLIRKILPESYNSHFCVAGGCFKSLIHQKEPNDIDLWPASESDRVLLIQEIVNHGGYIEDDGEFNTCIQREGSPKIEVTKKCPPSIDACLSHFDLVLSCIGVEFDSGAPVDSHVHYQVQKDIERKVVNVVDRIEPHKYNLLTLNRLKYYSEELGFTIPARTIDHLWRHAYSSASISERNDLLECANMQPSDVPLPFRIERVFVEGRPPQNCRPFTDKELEKIKTKLLSFVGNEQMKQKQRNKPLAVYVAGLPGSGKSTVIQQALYQLGIDSISNMVNLDMDEFRSYHGQFQEHVQGKSMGEDKNKRFIFKEAISWFNDGANAEYDLYKKPDSIAKNILQSKMDFILPIHK